MNIYYCTAPASAAKLELDGDYYIQTSVEMYALPDGRRHIREASESRMLKVTHIKNGMAFAPLGRAGDAITCADNLPQGVVCQDEGLQFENLERQPC